MNKSGRLSLALVGIGTMVAAAIWLTRDDDTVSDFAGRAPATVFGNEHDALLQRPQSANADWVPVSGDSGDNDAVEAAPAAPDCPKPVGKDAHVAVKQSLERAAVLLAEKRTAESLVVSAMLRESEKELSYGLLVEAAKADPNNVLVWWHLLRRCPPSDDIDCNERWLETSAVQADPENAAIWIAVAARRSERDDRRGATVAMRRAISAAAINTYIFEQVDALDRNLIAVSALSSQQRLLLGSDGVASSIPGIGVLRSRCSRSDDAEWLDLCAQLGRRMFSDARDVSVKRSGLDLQRAALSQQPDAAPTSHVDRRRVQLDEQQGQINSPEAFNLLFNDENVLRTFLANMQTVGEIAALEVLEADVTRLRATPGYDRCNFEVNPYIAF